MAADSTSSCLLSNLLQCISDGSPSVSPRLQQAPSNSRAMMHRHRTRVSNSDSGTLFPISTGWGALHLSAEVKQKPAALRNVKKDEVVPVATGRLNRAPGYQLKRNYLSNRKSLEVRIPTCRTFFESHVSCSQC
jgi:hypothetical protein